MRFWNFPDIFLCPCHEMAGSYSVTLFRHFVLLSFCHHSLSNHYINNLCMHQLKFDIWMYLINIKAEFKVGFGPMIVDRLMPLELEKKMGNSLSDHYLNNCCTRLNLVPVQWFLTELCLLNLKNEKFSVFTL